MIHNGSTYDYDFIIKQLAEEFEGQFDCIGENTEKYITFSVPIKKELDNGKTITHKLRLRADKLSNLVDNLSEIYKKECKACIEKMRKNAKNQVKMRFLLGFENK